MDDQSKEPRPPSFHVWLCGAFRVDRRVRTEYEAVRTAEWGGSSYPRLLLKTLLSCPGRQARREALIEMLWPDTDPEQAAHYLNTATTKLRKVLEPTKGQASLLLTEDDYKYYLLEEQHLLWVDVDAALALLKEAEHMRRISQEALPLLEKATQYFNQGTFLDGEEGLWASGKRATIERARYRCRLWLAEAYEEQGMPGQAEMVISTLLEEDPIDEDVLSRLMALLHRQGMTQKALRLYEQTCETLTREGLEPTEAIRLLAKRFQEQRYHQALDPLMTDEASAPLPVPDPRPYDIREYLHTKQIQRKQPQSQSILQENEPSAYLGSSTPQITSATPSFNQQGKGDYLTLVLSDHSEQPSSVFTHSLSFNEQPPASPFLELQQKLTQEVLVLNAPNKNNEGCLLSRREALLAIAVLAMPVFAPSQKRLTSLDIEEILSSLATSIHTCWQLSNKFDISAVYSVLSTYLPPLISIVRQSPSHRKAAAHLAAQAFLLTAIIGRHVANLQAAEDSCKEAVMYSEIAEDPVLHIATLRHLAMIYYYAKRHKQELALYQQIMPFLSLEAISPAVQSFVYAGRAGTQAINGLPHEARASLSLARKTFLQQPTAETCPLYIDYNYSQLFISEGLTYYDLGCYEEALESFLQVDGLSPKIPVAERGRLEFLNSQALTMLRLPHRDREMQQCITYWTAGIQGAMTLKSRQRYDEACRIYELMTFVWPHEKKIKELRDIIAQ